jgi:hypothetical protein
MIEEVLEELLDNGIIIGSLNPFKGKFTIRETTNEKYQR